MKGEGCAMHSRSFVAMLLWMTNEVFTKHPIP